MNVLDLCAGMGGLSLGFVQEGFNVLGVELDSAACRTHVMNVGPCVQADITQWEPTGHWDVVVGGVPCPPFSAAGQRGGFHDPRGTLYRHVIRIARAAGARVVLLENVPGFVTRPDWKDPVVKAFQDAGYYAETGVLNASAFGCPQNRKRGFVLATLPPVVVSWPRPTHGGPGQPRLATIRDALGLVGDFDHGGLVRPSKGVQGMRKLNVDAPSPTLTAGTNTEWLCPRNGVARRITPEEKAVLQGFPSDTVLAGRVVDRHRITGNAVPVPMARAWAKCILAAI